MVAGTFGNPGSQNAREGKADRMRNLTPILAVLMLCVIFRAAQGAEGRLSAEPAGTVQVASNDKGGGQKAKHKGQDKGEKVKVSYKGGGPPPWAPAHGYRSKQRDDDDDHGEREHRTENAAPTPYVAPFNINLGKCNRETLGTVLGGAAGGVLGSKVGGGTGKTAAIIGGTILGAIVGGSIGRSMDQLDQSCVGQILEHAPNRKPVEWKNPDNGAVYQVIPTETYQDPQGRYCREYRTSATIAGAVQQAYGTACRQPDGSWQIVSQ